jgi:phage repressor protein C with HTH and peptisase S24 domain
MAWAKRAIQDLNNGRVTKIRPHGNSMNPKIKSGQLVTISPSKEYVKGDIVLVKVKGRVFLHLIKSIKNNNQYCISNNRGYINGWVSKDSIYGKVIKIER